MRALSSLGLAAVLVTACARPGTGLEPIGVSADGTQFVRGESGARFTPWGFNHDHDEAGRLLEDYWQEEWPTVVEDFAEMRALGANVVRIHLQIARFLTSADTLDSESLGRLADLVALAESTGLYLDLTGLGCYHKADVPAWYDALAEAERWNAQAVFWRGVASVCAGSPAVFCYDLMNEPILPGAGAPETDWLAGAFAGKHFSQRIALDLGARTREQVAEAWVGQMVAAIREHDPQHLITVGVIPWALAFPGARPIFYATPVAEKLDFVSVHFYPETGQVDAALAALAVYDLGKPLVIEETFPLRCGIEDFAAFVERARPIAHGWIGFYWGSTREQCAAQETLRGALMASWLDYFRAKTAAMSGR